VRFAAWPTKAVQRKIWKLDRLSFYRLFLGCCPASGDAGFLVEGLSQVSSYFNDFHHVQSCSTIPEANTEEASTHHKTGPSKWMRLKTNDPKKMLVQ
jgi:hypothetical protein